LTESLYHSRVIKHLTAYGNETRRKYISAHCGSNLPVLISHPQANRRRTLPRPIQYEPDVYFIKRGKGKIVFEVLDSQLSKTSEIISDIIQCSISPDIDYLIFIMPAISKQRQNEIIDIYDIITDTLVNLGINQDWVPKPAVYPITRKESLSFKKVKTILATLSKQDGW